MVVAVEEYNELYVISSWLVERKGRMDIIVLNDYALGARFGGREFFEKRLGEQGFKVHRLISDPDDLETVKLCCLSRSAGYTVESGLHWGRD
jgi:hypothetical protein